MKIVFWSPVHRQSGMTSNILITALLCGMYDKKHCLITQTHFNYNNLEAPLVENNTKNAGDYFMDVGIDALIRRFKAEKINKQVIENCCISLPGTNISLLPGTAKTNRDAFEYEIGLIVPGLMREIEAYYDLVFVDVNPSMNGLSQKLMDDADLVVINLSQNIGMMNIFFHSFQAFMDSKLFYLFGNYDCNSKYNINNIRRKYKRINPANSGVIPYNTGFKDAQIESRVVEFVRRNLNCKSQSENYYFMMKSASAARKIWKAAGIRQANSVSPGKAKTCEGMRG